MERSFLFMSGEFRVTMPAVFKRDHWSHTMSPSRLAAAEGGYFKREHVTEKLKGVVFYADMDDKRLEADNILFIDRTHMPCWPPVKILETMFNRHEVMCMCASAGFVEHTIYTLTYEEANRPSNKLPFPYVVKAGNSHRGQDKFLVTKAEELPEWRGIATIEPFFEGDSCRVLYIAGETFGIRFDNSTTWIKNASGADVFEWTAPDNIKQHAIRVAENFGLEIAGVDYIVEKDGTFHFLEVNHFPGVDFSDETAAAATSLFNSAMDRVEAAANRIYG